MEVLREELAFYREREPELLERHPGQYALIKAHELVGVFPSPEEAYVAGVSRFGGDPFLIQHLVEVEHPEQVPLLADSIARADL